MAQKGSEADDIDGRKLGSLSKGKAAGKAGGKVSTTVVAGVSRDVASGRFVTKNAESSAQRIPPSPGHPPTSTAQHPLASLAGKYADDPLWDDMQQAMADNRREMDRQSG
jgi:hypothetical protein